MDPELQEIVNRLREMAGNNASDSEITAYLDSTGFKSVDEVFDLYDQAQAKVRAQTTDPRPYQPVSLSGGGWPAPIPGSFEPSGQMQQASRDAIAAGGIGFAEAALLGWGDEALAALTPLTFEQLVAAKERNPEAAFAGQMVGMVPTAIASGGLLNRLVPKGAGLMRTIGTGALMGEAEGGAIGSGMAAPGERVGSGIRSAALGGGLGLTFPALAAAGIGTFNAGRLLLGRQPFHAPTSLYDALEASPEYIGGLRPVRGGNLADALNRGEGGAQGTALVQAIGRGTGPATARDLRASVLFPRVEQMAQRAEQTGDRMMGDYARARGLSGRPSMSGGPGARTAWAEDIYQATENVVVDDPNVLRAVRNVERQGGDAFIDASRSAGRPEGELTWGELRELERRLRLADRDPSAANRPPRRLRQAYDELREAMENASGEFGEAQTSYRAGINVAGTTDELAGNIRRNLVGGELDTPQLPTLTPTQISDIQKVFGDIGEQRAVGLINEIRNNRELLNVLNQASRAAMRGGAKDSRLAETALTVAGYAGNNMYGAAFRTLVQRLLKGNEQTRRAARQVMELLLGDSQRGIEELTRVPAMLERARQRAVRRTGILSYLGARTGAGFLNQ